MVVRKKMNQNLVRDQLELVNYITDTASLFQALFTWGAEQKPESEKIGRGLTAAKTMNPYISTVT